MQNRIFIEPQAFATQKETLQGSVLLKDLDKRVWSHDLTNLQSEITYTLQGGVDRWQRPFLTLKISGQLPLQCQRCMQATDFLLDEEARIVLFPNEESLDEAMLADEELEGMLLSDELDILEMIEDQILIALPYSPKHEICENADLQTVNADKPNPFAMLAGLKKSD